LGKIIGALLLVLVGWAYGTGDVSANVIGSSITGDVVHNRSGKGVMGANVEITAYKSGVFQYSNRTATDQSGMFAFSDIQNAPEWAYVFKTQFEGGTYSVGPISHTENGNVQFLSILVYETVDIDPGIRIGQNAVIIREESKGVLKAIHSVTLLNPSSNAFVATGKGMVLKFDVPEQSYSLQPLQGFDLSDVTELDGQFNISTTVPPGDSNISYSYLFPWNPAGITVDYKINMPTEELSFTGVEGRIDIDSPDLVRGTSIVMSERASLARWEAASLPSGGVVELYMFDPRVSSLSRLLNVLSSPVLGLISLLLGLIGALFAFRHVNRGCAKDLPVNTEALFDELLMLERDARNGDQSSRLQANALRDRLVRLQLQRMSISGDFTE